MQQTLLRQHARFLFGGVGASGRWRGRELHRLLEAQTRADQIALVAAEPQQQEHQTHEIDRLLALVSGANREAADALSGAKWLGPFGVDIRYPGEAAEMLPGDEGRAIEIARLAKAVVLRILDAG